MRSVKKIGFYGASGHTKVLVEIAEKNKFEIAALYDDDPEKKNLLDYIIINDRSVFDQEDMRWIVGIGNNTIRKKIVSENRLQYMTLIDNKSTISERTTIGTGTVIMPGVTINSSVVIGEHSIINTNSSIDHDCRVGNFVHISPNATLCGNVEVGEGTHIGAASVIIPGIKIGKWCIVGAGSVIIRDIPDNTSMVGNPGRQIRKTI